MEKIEESSQEYKETQRGVKVEVIKVKQSTCGKFRVAEVC